MNAKRTKGLGTMWIVSRIRHENIRKQIRSVGVTQSLHAEGPRRGITEGLRKNEAPVRSLWTDRVETWLYVVLGVLEYHMLCPRQLEQRSERYRGGPGRGGATREHV